jgi:glutathione S-transferase
MVMEELEIPYTIQFVELSDVKKEEYTKINPNGRLPSIHDPNSNLTLWEVGQIITELFFT